MKKPHKTLKAEKEIRALAEKYKVAYTQTASDVLGHHITRLSGDDVELDEPAQLLLALQRAGYISDMEATRLHGNYLKAKYECWHRLARSGTSKEYIFAKT